MQSNLIPSEINQAIVLRYVDAFNRGDSAALREIYAGDAVVQGVLGTGGMEKVLAIWRELHEAFAIRLTVEEIVAEGDRVAVRYTERGTFQGQFRGHAPTGKSYELVAMEWFEVRAGKIQRRSGARDAAAQARQIGLPLN
jgi:steroid delta-isomerase-like uncharacterized protein